jgi:ABC-2 type transport system permease protein
MIGAILRAQFLSMRLRKGTRLHAAAFSTFTGLIFYGVWAFLAWGAMIFFSQPDQTPYFSPVLSSGLMFVMLYWQLAPVISASFGASIDLRKLLAYPIPHRQLFTVEILLRLTTCAEMLIVVGGASIGLLRNPSYGAGASPFIIAGAIIFSAINILLSAGTRNLLERIFLRTKLKEVLVFLLVLVSMVPRFLTYRHIGRTALLRFAPSQFFWPWAAAARLMLHTPGMWAGLCALLWLAAAWSFSRWQFERTIRYDATAFRRPTRPPRADGFTERLFQLPSRFLPDPLAALIEKELRTFSRIPRFRLVYAMSCFFGILMFLPMLRNPDKHIFFLQLALPLLALYGMLMMGQISYWNCLGFDRSAVQGYFSWPIRFRDVLIAKNLTIVALLIPQIAIVSVIARLFHIPADPAKIVETIVVMIVASLYWCAMGNILSVRIPRALDPAKMNQMSNKMQAMTIWAAPLLLLPIALAYWTRWFFENQLVFAGLLFVAAVVGAVFYWIGLDSAATTAVARRESIVTVLSGSEGPLSTN